MTNNNNELGLSVRGALLEAAERYRLEQPTPAVLGAIEARHLHHRRRRVAIVSVTIVTLFGAAGGLVALQRPQSETPPVIAASGQVPTTVVQEDGGVHPATIDLTACPDLEADPLTGLTARLSDVAPGSVRDLGSSRLVLTVDREAIRFSGRVRSSLLLDPDTRNALGTGLIAYTAVAVNYTVELGAPLELGLATPVGGMIAGTYIMQADLDVNEVNGKPFHPGCVITVEGLVRFAP